MATTTIPWGDGSGDNIYLTYSSASGNQTVDVTSDVNTGAARSKVVTFSSAVGSITHQLTVNQAAGSVAPVFYDYLYFDGTAYIETDYIAPQDASFRVGLGNETLKSAQRLFLMKAGTSDNIGALLNANTNTTRRTFSIYYGASSVISTSRTLNFSNKTYGFFLTSKRFGWGSTSYTFTKGSSIPTGGIIFGQNPSYTGQPYTGRMAIFYVYGSDTQDVSTNSGFNNYTPLATFRPCTYNGEAGFWYVEGNKFFGNTAGSGTLTASNS